MAIVHRELKRTSDALEQMAREYTDAKVTICYLKAIVEDLKQQQQQQQKGKPNGR
jgi:hypothetical protein